MSAARYVGPADFAAVHAGLRDWDRVVEWMETAFARRNHPFGNGHCVNRLLAPIEACVIRSASSAGPCAHRARTNPGILS